MPSLGQLESGVHEQLVIPDGQVWCVPHGVPAFHPAQPLPCVTQVCTPAPPHWVVPLVHPFVQHCALPGLPKQAPFEHIDVEDAYQQPCASCAQEAMVEPLAHAEPDMLHVGSMLHAQAAGPASPPPLQLWCIPHPIGDPHMPPAPHRWRAALPEHCVEFGTHEPAHAPIEHIPLMHGTGVPHAPPTHVCTSLPEHRVACGLQVGAPSLPSLASPSFDASPWFDASPGLVASLELAVVVFPPSSVALVSVAYGDASPSSPPGGVCEKSPRMAAHSDRMKAKTKTPRGLCEARDMLLPP